MGHYQKRLVKRPNTESLSILWRYRLLTQSQRLLFVEMGAYVRSFLNIYFALTQSYRWLVVEAPL